MLLCELTKHKIKIVFCDEKHNPQSELIPYYGSHDTSAKVRMQTQWSKEVKENIWTEIVSEKIRKQSDHLKENDQEVQADMLKQYVKEIELGDKTNREGHAAKVYFNALFGLDFSRSKECAINAALNYGYGILLIALRLATVVASHRNIVIISLITFAFSPKLSIDINASFPFSNVFICCAGRF